MNTQSARFPDGRYVIHNITGTFKGRAVAWYDAAGSLTDAQQIIGETSRPVKRGGPIWRNLASLGRVARNIA